MYRRTKEYIKSSNVSPDIFIEGYDYVNSELLLYLDAATEFENYIITKYEYRIDLISTDIYGSDIYSWIIMYINRLDICDLVRGRTIRYIPKQKLNTLIGSI